MNRTLAKLYTAAFVKELEATGRRGAPRFSDDHLLKIEVTLLYSAAVTGRDPVKQEMGDHLCGISEKAQELAEWVDAWVDEDEPAKPLPGLDDTQALLSTLRALSAGIDERLKQWGHGNAKPGRHLERPTTTLMVTGLAAVYRDAGGYVSANAQGEFAAFLGLLAQFVPDYLHQHIRAKGGVAKERRVADWFASLGKRVPEEFRTKPKAANN